MNYVPSSYRNLSSGSITFDQAGTAIGGTVDRSANFLTSMPFLSNQYGLSFFGTSDGYPSLNSDWNRIERNVSENAAAQIGLNNATSSANSAGNIGSLRNGIGFVPEGASASEELETAGEAGTSVLEAAEEGTGIAEAAAVGSTGLGVPVALAAAVNQQIGEAYVRAESANTENTITQNYAQNSAQHGLNTGLNSAIIRGNQEATRQNIESAGLAGSIFGLPGALIGQALASTVSANPNSGILDTAQSFGGAYNPSDTNAVASATTADLSGQSNLVDNVTS